MKQNEIKHGTKLKTANTRIALAIFSGKLGTKHRTATTLPLERYFRNQHFTGISSTKKRE